MRVHVSAVETLDDMEAYFLTQRQNAHAQGQRMQDYVTPLPLGLVVAAHAACLGSLIGVIVSPRLSYPGWRVVGPSGTHWFCFAGSWAFGSLMSWVWLFVGSDRADAAFQMRIALLLAVVFCTAAALSAFFIARLKRMQLRWRGSVICWRAGTLDCRQQFSQFAALRRGIDGSFLIRFEDQSVLTLDSQARNASDFLARFSEELGEDVY